MPLSATPVLGSGSVVAYEDPANVDVWIDLTNALQFGEIGSEASGNIDVTPISETEQQTIADRPAGVQVEMVFNDVALTAYETLLTNFVDNQSTIRFRHTMSNGRIAIRSINLAARKMPSPEAGAQIQMLVTGTQFSAPVWSIAA